MLVGTTPIVRIFDQAKAREFYVDFLGFQVDWEHRFEPGLLLYMQVSREGCVLRMPWGTRDMSIRDPFGNRLTFTSK
jgi:catechol 2,3-dioxygenase-like lactoylglutathione lyase family enzyme